MKLTDWRGNEYGAGSTVLYGRMSGRCVEIAEATVLDIWYVYRCPVDYVWKRLGEQEATPTERRRNRATLSYAADEPCRTELRVRLQPLGRGSRDFDRPDSVTTWPDGYSGERVDTPKPLRAVTLTVTENITVLP